MKKKFLACFLAVTLVIALVLVVAPGAKAAQGDVIVVDTDSITVNDANKDKVFDLNGQKNVTVTFEVDAEIKVIDTSFIKAVDENGKPTELDLTGKRAGTLTISTDSTGAGAVAPVTLFGDYRYFAVEENGTYAFHPFNMSITRTGINVTAHTVSLEAKFIASDVVRNLITDFGVKNITKNTYHSAKPNFDFNGKNGTVACYDLADSLNADMLAETRTFCAYIKIGDTVIDGLQRVDVTPKNVLGKISEEYAAGRYTGETKSLADKLYAENEYLQAYLPAMNPDAFKLVNGGFENGLEGWTVVGNIGGVSSDRNYWLNDPERAEGYAFGMDGDKMFSAYAPGAEERAVGILTSSTFKVGGSGFVTFKVGAMRDGNYVYVDVVDANTKQILARYYNGLWAERTEDVKSGCTLIAYKADLSAFAGKEVFFRISDNADSGYGLFFADSFVTYYENEPEGFNAATPVNYTVSGTIYDLFNGGFEMGDVQGWWNIGEIGLVTNANGYWGDNIPYNKDGDYLFTGVESHGADTMREGNRGTLTSSAFELGGTGWISFKLGGGGNELCYVQVIDATTNEVLARFRQQAQQDAVLIQYVADLSAHIGKTVRIQVVDYASSGWGCVSFDSVKTYYVPGEAMPEGHVANNIFHGVYDVTNGSFENGLDGWNMHITEAGAHNTLGWVESFEHDAGWYTKNDGRKDGNNLFTFCRPDGTNCENTKGTLNSAVFTLKSNTFVSFRFGGAGTHDVHVQLCRADGSVIATFYNEAPGKLNTEMFAYFYYYTGETADCFFRVVDNSQSNYGCFVVDDFRANLANAPEGFIAAIQ